jgi:hypothetical protein
MHENHENAASSGMAIGHMVGGTAILASPILLVKAGVEKVLQKSEERKAEASTSPQDREKHDERAKAYAKGASFSARAAVATAGGPATVLFYGVVAADVAREDYKNDKKSNKANKTANDSTPINKTNVEKYGTLDSASRSI